MDKDTMHNILVDNGWDHTTSERDAMGKYREDRYYKDGHMLKREGRICYFYRTHRRTRQGLVEMDYMQQQWMGLCPDNERKLLRLTETSR